jgi:hypothetical protein
VIDPRFMNVLQWTDRMAETLPFPVYRLLDEDEWRAWARNLIQYPQVSALNPPDPEYFVGWQEWAERFNQAVVELQ